MSDLEIENSPGNSDMEKKTKPSSSSLKRKREQVDNADTEKEAKTRKTCTPFLKTTNISLLAYGGYAMEIRKNEYVELRMKYQQMKGAFRPPQNSKYSPNGDYLALADFWANEPDTLEEAEELIAKCNAACETRAELGIIGSMWSVFLPVQEVFKCEAVFDFMDAAHHPLSLRSFPL